MTQADESTGAATGDTDAPSASPTPQGAAAVARGVRRLLARTGLSSDVEVSLANGRRADIVALAGNGEIWIVEIKTSRAEFRADDKWPDYRDFCDRFFFAVPSDFPTDILPTDTGLIVADAFDAAILVEAPHHKLAGARRRAVIHRLAQQAMRRLHRLADPYAGEGA